MKELTIEQKAQRYDEAIQRAHDFCKRWDGIEVDNSTLVIKEVKEIFPELKEREDERIRKALIRAFKSLNTIKVWSGIEHTDIIAWLEKQGSHTDKVETKFKVGG